MDTGEAIRDLQKRVHDLEFILKYKGAERHESLMFMSFLEILLDKLSPAEMEGIIQATRHEEGFCTLCFKDEHKPLCPVSLIRLARETEKKKTNIFYIDGEPVEEED